MHEWGYAPTPDALAANLLGGSASRNDLARAIERASAVRTRDGVVFLDGHERLVVTSRERIASDQMLNGQTRVVAERYARDLVRACPFIECVALAGSAASGGYAPGDDIDFDLFVSAGAKYTTYLLANLIGLRYAWRYRRVGPSAPRQLPRLPKIICINVVWPADQTRPFVRQDAGLAFELARCIPLFGTGRFRQAILDNPWIRAYLPQLDEREWRDAVRPGRGGTAARVLAAIARHPRLLRAVERTSREIAWSAYRFVQESRRAPGARERMEFLRRVKYPYEVFQD